MSITEQSLPQYMKMTRFLIGSDVCKQMVSALLREYDVNQYRFRFVSFNGSNFDDYFLMNQACANEERVSATFQSKSILSLTMPYGQCWDLAKFICGSLKGICESFQVYPKKMDGFDHKLP